MKIIKKINDIINWMYFLLQVAMGLINSRASHIVWPPKRWGRMDLKPAKGRVNTKETQKRVNQRHTSFDEEDS